MTKKQEKSLLVALIIFFGLLLWSASNAQTKGWEYFGPGIEHLVIHDKIHIFKIDQTLYKFKAKGSKDTYKLMSEWVEGEIGGINLNMYVPGTGLGADPRGYAKIDNKVIQAKIKSDYNLFIVWDDNRLTILDRTEESMDSIMSWPNISQNIRMMQRNINGKTRWQLDRKKWSVAAIATTVDNNILLIHSREPYQMYHFNKVLLYANRWLRIDRMAYLEGGPESSIIITNSYHSKFNYSQLGSYETGYYEYYDNKVWYKIPWVLCFSKK